MARVRMHLGEIETDIALVRRLLAAQFPMWKDERIEFVPSFGTDHDIYRLGETLVVRLPRIDWARHQAAKEAFWLPKLAPSLPLSIPVPVAAGLPTSEYPYEWSICKWLPGESATDSVIADLEQTAIDLAQFVRVLQKFDTAGAPARLPGQRGAPLRELDASVRSSIAALGSRVDGQAVYRSWEESVQAPVFHGTEVWIHGDLLPGNLLIVDGRLSAVIDFGGLNVGDPACDLQPAWALFHGKSRDRFRADLEVDDASWLRGRGWSLCQAVLALPYYWDTNPGIVRLAHHALGQILEDS
jgi:aminoglycoside phosphotransferase (APT) family kinase protein